MSCGKVIDFFDLDNWVFTGIIPNTFLDSSQIADNLVTFFFLYSGCGAICSEQSINKF